MQARVVMKQIFDPRRDVEKTLFIREGTRRVAKDSKGGPDFLCMTAWFCAD